jgi:RNA polymerase sigma-70 factor (ECF subfamily)
LLAALVPVRRREQDDCDALVERVAAHDRAALRALYDALGGHALAIARRVLGSHGDAEEVVQDTFVEIWRRAATFDRRRGTGRAWALSIARYRAIDRVRERAAASRLIDRVSAVGDAAEPPSPIAEVSERELRARVTAALAALSADERGALELAYYEGLSHSEISRRLAAPLGTIKTRLRAAMAKLSSLLDHGDAP